MAAGGCSSPGNVSQQLEGSSKSAKARAVRVNSGAVSTWQGWASGGQGGNMSSLCSCSSCSSGRGRSSYCLRGPWLLHSGIPVVIPSLEACLREITQIFWGKKGAQMHLCWELLLVCARQSTELLLHATRGDQGGNHGAEEQGQPGEGDRHCVRAKGWLVWEGSRATMLREKYVPLL